MKGKGGCGPTGQEDFLSSSVLDAPGAACGANKWCL